MRRLVILGIALLGMAGVGCITIAAGTVTTGSGRVTGDGIDCRIAPSSVTGTCSSSGEPAVLTAVPDPGSHLSSWSSSTCNVIVDPLKCQPVYTSVNCIFVICLPFPESPTVTVDFKLGQPTVTIDPNPNPAYIGAGRVTGPGINCTWNGTAKSGTCAALFDGSVVTLTATADAGSYLLFMAGCDSFNAGTGTCSVSELADRTVEPTFALSSQ